MTEDDGFRQEAAEQIGFQSTNDDCTEFKCTAEVLWAFARACEHKGMYDALAMSASDVQARMETLAAEVKPFVEAETVRFMTAQGYVPAPAGHPSGKLWIKPECS